MELNFEDVSEVKGFLKRDKHHLLEGMVVEDLFMHDIALRCNWGNLISKGWWAIKHPSYPSVNLLFHVLQGFPSMGDLRVYNELIRRNIPVVHVMFQDNHFYFLEITKLNVDVPPWMQVYLNEEEFKSKYNRVKQARDVFIAEEEDRDNFRQNRAIMFLEGYNFLNELIVQRYFANYFLHCFFTEYIVNIDAFISLSDSELTLIEIKFKFPYSDSGSLYYGINKGQSNLFKWSLTSNIKVLHYIAKNPRFKKEFDIFDILSTTELKERFFWEYRELNKNELNGIDLYAPKDTSYKGVTAQKYKGILANGFTVDNPVGVDFDFSWVPKRPCPDCDGFIEVLNGPYGYYKKCPNHKKKSY
jgi:hypothetical protein